MSGNIDNHPWVNDTNWQYPDSSVFQKADNKALEKCDNLMKDWCDFAGRNETDSKVTSNLIKRTENVVSYINKMIKNGQLGGVNDAFSRAFLNTSDDFVEDNSTALANWLNVNSTQFGNYADGASVSFHNFVETIKAATEAGMPSHLIPSVSKKLLKIDLASRKLLESKDYKGPLKMLKIDTADKVIVEAKRLGEKLTSIDISDIDFSDAEKFEELIQCLPNIVSLKANKCKIDDNGLNRMDKLQHLKWIYLEGNNIGHKGAMEIVEKCPNLTSLNIKDNHVGNVGAMLIIDNLKKLQTLVIQGNGISPDASRTLARRLQVDNLDGFINITKNKPQKL